MASIWPVGVLEVRESRFKALNCLLCRARAGRVLPGLMLKNLLKKWEEDAIEVRKYFLLLFGITKLSVGKPEQIKTTKITIRNTKHIHFSYDILHMSGGANWVRTNVTT